MEITPATGTHYYEEFQLLMEFGHFLYPSKTCVFFTSMEIYKVASTLSVSRLLERKNGAIGGPCH